MTYFDLNLAARIRKMFDLIDKNRGYLFMSRYFSDVLNGRRGALQSKIDSLDGNRLLNTSPNDLIEHFVKKYALDLPIIKRDAVVLKQ